MTYILNRLLSLILTLVLISVITFSVTNILPGDVAMMIMGTQSNPEALEGLRESLGLNDPLIVQFGRFVGNAATFNFGISYQSKQPVAKLIMERLPATLLPCCCVPVPVPQR